MNINKKEKSVNIEQLKNDLEYHIKQHKYYQNRCFELEERLEYVKERHNEICQEDFIIE